MGLRVYPDAVEDRKLLGSAGNRTWEVQPVAHYKD
jgi:hypothetical protein